jgi:hypothetical protein
MARTKVFVSYSHKDDHWRKQIVDHLAVLAEERLIDLYDDRKIEAGEDWFKDIHMQMLSARIAMLLISSSFLTSRFIRDEEVPKLFARHAQDGMRLYPVLIKPCPWQVVKWLSTLQFRPPDAKPLASFAGVKREEVLASIALEIASLAGKTIHAT